MENKLFLNNEVSKIVGLTSRQIISWTEKGLVMPEKPAKKAGSRRGYSYVNLLEFGLAKYLLDVIGLQFYTAKAILDALRDDDEITNWARNYSQYCLSFETKIMDKNGDELCGGHLRVRENDPEGLGGTAGFVYDGPKAKEESGTLYYIITGLDPHKETIRIISPWDVRKAPDAFIRSGGIEDIVTSRGMIVINLGKIKHEIDIQIRE
ncbi:MAG: MerR family transcriptional regulator [Deltaproteobacteria bacterium]|nr:MerR family transcriptional regulator [Deltaproteobacteria bacterium]